MLTLYLVVVDSFLTNINFLLSFRIKEIVAKYNELTKKSLDGASDGDMECLYMFLLLYYNRRTVDETNDVYV